MRAWRAEQVRGERNWVTSPVMKPGLWPPGGVGEHRDELARRFFQAAEQGDLAGGLRHCSPTTWC
jgi:hypothetical protein